MSARKPSVVVSAPPRSDGLLSIVEVTERACVLSTGEELVIRYEKARMLAEQMCQEQAVVQGLRTWWTKDGNELIEFRRGGVAPTESVTAAPLKMPTVF